MPLARLRPGVDPARAAAFVNTMARQIPPAEEHSRVHGARLDPLTGTPGGDERMMVAGFLGMLFATALVVLMIGAANIAGLLVTRGLARQREFALRRALGAARGRVVRQLLTETTILFLIGGGCGLVMAYGLTRVLQRLTIPIPLRIELELTPELRVLGFGLVLAALTGTALGLVPALRSSRIDLIGVLKEGSGGAGAARSPARTMFVSGQLALAVVLLVVTGLFVRTLQRSLAADPGFSAEGVVVATTNLDPHGYEEARGRLFFRQLLERVRALPGRAPPPCQVR